MSRPRQDPDIARKELFQRAVLHGQVDAGLTQKKALAEASGIPYATLWKRLDDPDNMTVAELRKIIGTIPIDPDAVLTLVGYSRKDILRRVDHSA